MATLAVVLLQHAINLFNDASDWKLGADTEKADSWVRVHNGDIRPVKLHAIISFSLGGFLGLYVVFLADKLWILLVAAPLIILGYLYNAGERPLSYTWMGEWVTGICYGGVFFCLWLLLGLELNLSILLGTLSFAALAMSLLLSHQPPQIQTDKMAGKHSFAVRYGSKATIHTSLGLLLFALLALGISVIQNTHGNRALWLLLIAAMLAAWVPFKMGINPKSILISASLSIIAMLFI